MLNVLLMKHHDIKQQLMNRLFCSATNKQTQRFGDGPLLYPFTLIIQCSAVANDTTATTTSFLIMRDAKVYRMGLFAYYWAV